MRAVTAVSELRSVLDQVAALDVSDLDPNELSDPELLESLPLLHVGISKIAALMTRCVAVTDRRQAHRADGMVTVKSWLTGHCRMSGTEASAMVRAGRRLEKLPELAAAYAEGAVATAHVNVVTSALTPARLAAADTAGIHPGTTDRVLTEAARSLGPEDTAKATTRWVIGVDPDGTLDDDAGRPRVFRLARSSGGRVYFSGHADPVGGEIMHTALEAMMNGYRPADDRRSHAERQGDALVELCRQALNGGSLPTVRGERPQVRVSIDLMALCAESGVGVLPFAGPISAETARRLACDASVVRLLVGPDGLPLDVGREKRTATAAIRRAVELRDVHCVFAGCTAPAAWCDVHHVVHWAHGGVTSCENGALLCERHHTAVHEGRFNIARDPHTAVWHTYRPDGSEIFIRGPSP